MKKYLLLIISTVLIGSISYANPGLVDNFHPNALKFDGANDYVSIGNSSKINNGGPYTDRTIEAWFYCVDAKNGSKKQVVYEEGDATRGFNIYVFDGKLYVGGWNANEAESNWNGTWLSTDQVVSNTWHHVALRLQGGINSSRSGAFSGFFDGIEFAKGNGAKVYAHEGASNIGNASGTRFHDGIDNSNQSYFEGMIDEVRIWNESRSTEEIRGNMFRQLSSKVISLSPNLAAYYTMDQKDGNLLHDFSGNINEGTLNNMNNESWVRSTVLYDLRQSLDFDGTDDYVSLGKNKKFQLENTITLEAWIYPRSMSQGGAIFSNLQNNEGQKSGYGLIVDRENEKIVWWLQTVGAAASTSFTPELNVWQHVACTYNGSEMRLFVDGVLVDTKAITGSIDWSYVPVEARIGSFVDDDEVSFFNGSIDDVRIWSSALNEDEIKSSMNNPLWGTEPNLVAYYRFDQINDLNQSALFNVQGDFESNGVFENFDSYSVNTNVSAISGWETWSGGAATAEDPIIVSSVGSSFQNAMQITGSNDILFKNGNLTTGIHSVKFRMFVPAGKHGYFNIEHYDIPGIEWTIDAFFDGSGNVKLTTEGNANAAKFTYPNNEWFTVEVRIDLGSNVASFYLNSTLKHSWKWNIDSFGKEGAIQLGCVDFFAFDPEGPESPLFYVDDFSVSQLDAEVMNGLLVNMDGNSDWTKSLTTNLWIGQTDTDWAKSSNWLTGNVPAASDLVRIDRTESGNYPVINSNQEVAKLSIGDGASLEIGQNKSFDIHSSIVNQGLLSVKGNLNLHGMLQNYHEIDLSGAMNVGGKLINNGNFNILSNENSVGSLIDHGDVSGSGEFKVQSYLSSNEKWHLVSSPVENAYSGVFSDRSLLTYTESNDLWSTILSTDKLLPQMKGYATLTNAKSTASNTYLFKGNINTGDFISTLSHAGTNSENQNFNLIGNPYVSSIDWDLVTVPADMDNVIYFLNPDGQYASYINGISINGGSRYIAPGQGFWVRVKTGTDSATPVDFTLQNKDRVNAPKDRSNKESVDTGNEYQFSLFATYDNKRDEAVLVFDNATSSQFDSEYDAVKYAAYENDIPNIYFVGDNNEHLAIDARPETSEVNVGFMMKQSARNVKISVNEADNFASVVLEDLFTGEKVDLLEETYTFDYNAVDDANRFKLHFDFMSTENADPAENELQIYGSQSDLVINSTDGINNPVVQVYDIQGRMVYQNADLGFTTYKRIPLNLSSGTYIVKLILEDSTKSEKVFL